MDSSGGMAVAADCSQVARISYADEGDPVWRRMLIRGVEKLSGSRKLERLYDEIKRTGCTPEAFFEMALSWGAVRVERSGFDVTKLPADRPLLLVANHPYGVVDGLVLCRLALEIAGDFRILIHSLLCADDFLRHYFLPVDFTKSSNALHNNIRTKRLAVSSMRAGIPVAIFPSGAVSTARGIFGFGALEELPWTTFAARLALASGALVLPVSFHGRNSRAFHLASSLSESLRLSLLVHETLRMFGGTVRVTIGNPVDILRDVGGMNRNEITQMLREAVLGPCGMV